MPEKPCFHTLVRWLGRFEPGMGLLYWAICCDCGQITETGARSYPTTQTAS